MSARPSWPVIPLLALGLVLLATTPSLGGGWVWDDHIIVAANPALYSVADTLQSDVFGPAMGTPSDAWRPLAMLSHVPGTLAGWGPGGERILSLGLHLLAVTALARTGRSLGLGQALAWFSALLFGLHPATAELVAWISGRHDELALLLLLAGTAAWSGGHRWTAAVLLALAPWCKESLLVAPAIALLWTLGDRRLHPAWLLPFLSPILFIQTRQQLGLPLPETALDVGVIAPLGGAFRRLLELLLLPTHADALALHQPSLALGVVALAIGGVLVLGSWGRRGVAACTALLLPILPAAVAMQHSGLASDRYVVPGIAAAALALGLLLARLSPHLPELETRSRRLIQAGVVGILALLFAARATAWTSDAALFGDSLARDPGNNHAAFHVATDLHQRQGDCAAAIPLYRQGLAADDRAGTNLLACLLDEGRLDEALAEGPAIAAAALSPAPAANLARAASKAGELELALHWAGEAVARDPAIARNQRLHGQLLAQSGAYDAAAAAFTRALALEPDNPENATLLERVQALLSAP